MKTLLLITYLFIFSCIPFVLSAQQNNWKAEVKKQKTKIEQVQWLLDARKNNTYKEHHGDMLEMAFDLAQQTGVDTLIAKVYWSRGNYLKTLNRYDKSWSDLVTARYLMVKAKRYDYAATILYMQAIALLTQGFSDSMLVFLKKHQAFINAAAHNKDRLAWNSLYPLAYERMNMLGRAKSTMQEQLHDIEANGDTDLVLAAYINLGRLYNDFDSSMALYSKGLAMADKKSSKYTELLYRIGYVYGLRDDKQKDSALYYYLEALKNSDNLVHPIFKCNIEGLIGDFFMNRDEYALALPYLRKSYECSKDIGLVYRSTSAHNMAICYVNLKKADSAAFYLDIHKRAVEQMDNDYQFMLYYQIKAKFEALKSGDSCSLTVLQNYDKSVSHAIKAEEERVGMTTLIAAMVCAEQGDRTKMKPVALSLLGYCQTYHAMMKGQDDSKYHSAQFLSLYAKLESIYGDKAKANILYEELVVHLAKLEEGDYVKGLGEAVVKYKSDLKDTEITLLNERQQAAAIRTILIIVGLFLVLCVAAVIYVLYRREHNTRQMLDERNHKVEQLLREVHHRVKNNLQIVSSFINIQLDKVTDKEARVALEDTSTRIMALAGLHQSLYRQDDLSRIQLNQYIEELCKVLGSGINQDVEISCDLEDLQLNIDQAIPIGLAVNELITNALKHAFPQNRHGRISVELKHKEKWQLIVKDNGNGLPENMNPDSLESIGIRLVQDIAERQLNGTFSYYNEEGAVFKIEFIPMAA